MKNNILIFTLFIAGTAICMNQKNLSPETIEKLKAQYAKKWYHRKRALEDIFWEDSTPEDLYKNCMREVKECTQLCWWLAAEPYPGDLYDPSLKFKNRDLACGTRAEIQRTMHCWWLHKKALMHAALQK